MGTSRLLAVLATHSRALWIGALVWYGIGDTVTTVWGLRLADGVGEAGPIAAPLMETYGVVSLLWIKAALFLSGYLLWTRLTTPGRVAVPLALLVVGVTVTVWNGVVIALG
jgi:hypothetical protein